MTGDHITITDLLEAIKAKNRTSPASDQPAHRKETVMTTSPPTPAGLPPGSAPAEDYTQLLFDQAEAWFQRSREAERAAVVARGRGEYFMRLANQEKDRDGGTAPLIPGDESLPVLQAAAAEHNGRTSAATATTGLPAQQAAGGQVTDEAPSSMSKPDHHVNGAQWASSTP